jgi:hypothetical protein
VSGWPADLLRLQRHAAVRDDEAAVGRDDLHVIERLAGPFVCGTEHGRRAADVQELATVIGQDEELLRHGRK